MFCYCFVIEFSKKWMTSLITKFSFLCRTNITLAVFVSAFAIISLVFILVVAEKCRVGIALHRGLYHKICPLSPILGRGTWVNVGVGYELLAPRNFYIIAVHLARQQLSLSVFVFILNHHIPKMPNLFL